MNLNMHTSPALFSAPASGTTPEKIYPRDDLDVLTRFHAQSDTSALGMRDAGMRLLTARGLRFSEDKATLPNNSAVIDLAEATLSTRSKSTAFSTHDSQIISYRHADMYLKCNGHNLRATYCEGQEGMFYHDFVKAHGMAADVKFCVQPGKFLKNREHYVGIASTMLEGFIDWGEFLVNKETDGLPVPGTAPALAHLKGDKGAYVALLAEHDTVRHELAAEESRIAPKLKERGWTVNNKTTHVKAIPYEIADKLDGIHRLEKRRMDLENKMLALLPPEFNSASIQMHYEGEPTGNLDLGNHKRANSGPVIRGGKLVGVSSVDHGVSGFNGFEGKKRSDSYRAFTVPARLNDPFICNWAEVKKNYNKNDMIDLTELYPQGQQLDPRLTDFTYVSQTPSLRSTLIRADSTAAPMNTLIKEFRESDELPEEMFPTAYRLSLVKHHDLLESASLTWEECERTRAPAFLAMLQECRDEQCTPDVIADKHYARFQGIVERAGGALQNWAAQNRDLAAGMERDIARTRKRMADRRAALLKPQPQPLPDRLPLRSQRRTATIG